MVEEKRTKKKRAWVSSKGKNGEVCDTFLAFCELSRVCIWPKFPKSHQELWLTLSRWPTRPLCPQVLAVTFFLLTVGFPRLLLIAISCRLVSSVQLWDFSSLFLFRPRNISLAQALCVGFAQKKKKESSDWYLPTPTETNATHRITMLRL